MKLGEIIRLTHHDMQIQEQKLTIFPRRGVIFTCIHSEYEKWGPLADREVTGLRAKGWNELVIFVEAPAEQDEDPQIPGQMDISDYGIMGG